MSAEDVVDDVAFLLWLIRNISGAIPISAVYATGHSNGCSMVHRLAAEAPPGIIDAIACMAGYQLMTESISRYAGGISVMNIFGGSDDLMFLRHAKPDVRLSPTSPPTPGTHTTRLTFSTAACDT